MLKTTTGKSLEERLKLPRNRDKSDYIFLSKESYAVFKKNTGRKHISFKTRSAVIKEINRLVSETVLEGHYNVRIPNLGIITLIKFKMHSPAFKMRSKKGDMACKIHIYFQVSGEERRVHMLDFDFVAQRKYSRKLRKDFLKLQETIKESF